MQTVERSPSTVTHVYQNGPAQYYISALVTDQTGTTVVAGGSSDSWGLDQSFGTDGRVVSDLSIENGHRVETQPDGKILTLGYSFGGTDFLSQLQQGGVHFVITRYNPDGSLDTSFGNDGTVVTQFLTGSQEEAYDMAIAPDGTIIVVGQSISSGASGIAIARYNPNGTLDTSFGNGGLVVTPTSGGVGLADSIALEPDGTIVVGGTTNGGDLAPSGSEEGHAQLLSFNSDGTLDTSFGDNGILTTSTPGFAYVNWQSVDSGGDGKLLVSFSSNNFGAEGIVRYNLDGIVDTTFGTNGSLSIGGSPAILPTGQFLIASETSDLSGVILQRYTANGTLDSTFGAGGTVTTSISVSGFVDEVEGAYPESNGDVVVAAKIPNASNDNLALIRYLSDGTLDTSFGTNGFLFSDVLKQTTGPIEWGPIYAQNSWPINVAFMSNGKIVYGVMDVYVLPDAPYLSNGEQLLELSGGDPGLPVTVIDAGPSVTITGPSSPAYTETTLSFESNVTDPSPAQTAAGFTYAWSVEKDGSSYSLASGINTHLSTLSFIPSLAGDYVVSLTATAQDGLSATQSDDVTVETNPANLPPVSINGASTADEGAQYDLALTVSTSDPIQQWQINWGDGTGMQTVFGTPSSLVHVYENGGGNYIISAEAFGHAANYVSNTVAVAVSNVGPRVQIGNGQPTSPEGQLIDLTGNASDPGTAETLSYLWTVTKDGSAFDTATHAELQLHAPRRPVCLHVDGDRYQRRDRDRHASDLGWRSHAGSRHQRRAVGRGIALYIDAFDRPAVQRSTRRLVRQLGATDRRLKSCPAHPPGGATTTPT